jgi:hypothetical protein
MGSVPMALNVIFAKGVKNNFVYSDSAGILRLACLALLSILHDNLPRQDIVLQNSVNS